jgi:hypothetical protein
MCESRVYLLRGGKKEKVMDAAVSVKDEGGRVLVVGLEGAGEGEDFGDKHRPP